MNRKVTELIAGFAKKVRVFKAITESMTGPEDLTDREILILELLMETEGMSVTDISSGVRTPVSTISADVSNLWKNKGFVQKFIDPQNERMRIIKLTPEGEKKLQSAMRERGQVFAEIVKSLSMTAEEETVVVEILSRAIQQMDLKIQESLKES